MEAAKVEVPESTSGQAPSIEVTPSAESTTDTSSNVFEKMSNEKPMDMKTIFIFSLIIVASIYSIVYHRKAIKKLEESVKTDDFLNLVDDVEEIKYNVKKAMGKRYKTTE